MLGTAFAGQQVSQGALRQPSNDSCFKHDATPNTTTATTQEVVWPVNPRTRTNGRAVMRGSLTRPSGELSSSQAMIKVAS